MTVSADRAAWWAQDCLSLQNTLDSEGDGLSMVDATERLQRFGPNRLFDPASGSAFLMFVRQFSASLVLTLLAAAAIAGAIGEYQEAAIIAGIVLISCLLSFLQEYRASNTMQHLRARLATTARVSRDGRECDIPVSDIVPGDHVLLFAGSLIPADGIVLDAHDLSVSEASLTGEAFPVEKMRGVSAVDGPLSGRTNALYRGTSVRSGYGRMLVAATGQQTAFAAIERNLAQAPPESAFAMGLRRFGNTLTRIMLSIVIIVFAINLLLHRPMIASLLFSVALGVGMTPELLPAIMSVTLTQGARMLARSGVMVRHLGVIENLGSINILCTDKTGTLTVGSVVLRGALDISGRSAISVLTHAYWNARLQTGMQNAIDDAILAAGEASFGASTSRKIAELPYDFNRRRLTVICTFDGGPPLMLSKGALKEILDVSAFILDQANMRPITQQDRAQAQKRLQDWSEEGARVLGVAYKEVKGERSYSPADERDLVFCGFLVFSDQVKSGVREVVAGLGSRGVAIRIVTGDNRFAAAHIAREVGLPAERILTGEDFAHLTRRALEARVARTDLFAELDPAQKERVVLALRSCGNIVGYLGDGINDAPALRAADVGISVEGAVDVARDAADFVLLEKDLSILLQGLEVGRRIFANTIKYISITMSANFGNMISMAAASIALPFLPMLAKQILLNNLLSDLPALAIATDNVDEEDIAAPQRWSVAGVARYMIAFGLISSVFDALSFVFLFHVLGVDERGFQTSWFILSLASEVGIVLILRTRRFVLNSQPSRLLVASSVIVLAASLVLMLSPLALAMDFARISTAAWVGVVGIVLSYLVVSELVKTPARRWAQAPDGTTALRRRRNVR